MSPTPRGQTSVPLLSAPDLTSWTEATRLLCAALSHAPPEHRRRLHALQNAHLSVRIRLEQSLWFGEHVVRLRSGHKEAVERTRCFDAFLFFAWSALDCEACYAHELCELKGRSDQVYIMSISGRKSVDEREWPELKRVLDAHQGSTWFRLFHQLRTVATHRSVAPTGGFLGHWPSLRGVLDINFVPVDPENPITTFKPRAELGLGTVVEKSYHGVCGLVGELEIVLLDYVLKGRAKWNPSPRP